MFCSDFWPFAALNSDFTEWIRGYRWILYDVIGENSVKLDMIATSQHYVMYNVTLG